VLKLRAEIEGQWGGTAPAPDKYLDLSYYDKARSPDYEAPKTTDDGRRMSSDSVVRLSRVICRA
jgi:hypothetical protein